MIKKIFYVFLILITQNLHSITPRINIPIVYHNGYAINNSQLSSYENNIFYFPESDKIYQNLLALDLEFHEPYMVDYKDIKTAHKKKYVRSIIKDNSLVNAQRFATGGTILTCNLAMKYGWAINLGGGFNLASADSEMGPCILSDVTIAINRLWNENPFRLPQILIIDLSAVQSTTFADFFQNNFNVKLFQMYNASTFLTHEQSRSDLITFNIPINSEIASDKYFETLADSLKNALEFIEKNRETGACFWPDLIVYIAGTDLNCYMPNITEDDIINRDALVFSLAKIYNIPIAMVTGPSCPQSSPDTISKSIQNILRLKNIL